ncbi:MAG: hypothetical protein ACPIOQ_49510 [Promethearchaeia archaeon]
MLGEAPQCVAVFDDAAPRVISRQEAAEALAPYRLSCLSLDPAPSHAAPSVHGEGGIGRSGP